MPPAARKPPKPVAPPAYFPPENVLARVMPPALAGKRDFDEYHFSGLDFSGQHLSGWRFSECWFENCNLAGATIDGTAFQNVAFNGCKLLGLPFQSCRELLFGVHFTRCQLDYASFYGRSMPNTRFVGCSLLETEFTATDLTQAVFDDCQLTRAVFQNTNLTGTDLRTARDLALDPAFNEVKKARFALESLPGLLTKFGLIVE